MKTVTNVKIVENIILLLCRIINAKKKDVFLVKVYYLVKYRRKYQIWTNTKLFIRYNKSLCIFWFLINKVSFQCPYKRATLPNKFPKLGIFKLAVGEENTCTNCQNGMECQLHAEFDRVIKTKAYAIVSK